MGWKAQIQQRKDAVFAADPSTPEAIARQIEQAASAKFPTDMAARFQYRNQLRAQAGLKPEERERGGLAGAYDRGDLTKALGALAAVGTAGLLMPAAAGAGTAGAAGTAAAGAGTAGALAPAAAGGFMSKAGDFLKQNALPIATGVAGVAQQAKGNQIMGDAAKLDSQRWAAGASLRDAGRAGLLAPTPGNPFAAQPVAPQPVSPQAPIQPVPALGKRKTK
jgi:hypothetical protein